MLYGKGRLERRGHRRFCNLDDSLTFKNVKPNHMNETFFLVTVTLQMLNVPDLASRTSRMVTAWSQLIPNAATRWESYLLVCSWNLSFNLAVTEKIYDCGRVHWWSQHNSTIPLKEYVQIQQVICKMAGNNYQCFFFVTD